MEDPPMAWTAADEGLLHGLQLRHHLAAGGELAPQPTSYPLPEGEIQYFATEFRLLRLIGTQDYSYWRLRPKRGDPLGALITAPIWIPVNLLSRSVAKRPSKPDYEWQEVSRGTLILTDRRMLQLLWGGKCEPFEPRGITQLQLWPGGICFAAGADGYMLEVNDVTAPWLYIALSYLVLGDRRARLDIPMDYVARAQAEGKRLPSGPEE
jgi:hypothetical protein